MNNIKICTDYEKALKVKQKCQLLGTSVPNEYKFILFMGNFPDILISSEYTPISYNELTNYKYKI